MKSEIGKALFVRLNAKKSIGSSSLKQAPASSIVALRISESFDGALPRDVAISKRYLDIEASPSVALRRVVSGSLLEGWRLRSDASAALFSEACCCCCC